MPPSKIRDVQNAIRRGELTAKVLEESLHQIEVRDGDLAPVLCRTPAEVDVADRIEWAELTDAMRGAGVSEERLEDIKHIRQRYVPDGGKQYELFGQLGGMPPTVAFAIAIANLGSSDALCSKAVKDIATVAHIRRDLLALNDEVLFEKLGFAVSHKRPVHAFLRREGRSAVLICAEELDEKRRAGEYLPLAGVSIGVKDLFALGKTTGGSRILSDYTAPQEYVATAVRNLLEAGAVSLGKTNLDEFALGSSCTSTAYWPAPRNPHDTARVAGGSSGGSAAAVAAGMVLGAIGSDTAGSIRVPASYCGVVGVKPTYGLVSRFGLLALASSLDCVGPIARTVADAAILLGHMVGDRRDPFDQTMRHIPHANWHPDFYAAPLLNNGEWAGALRRLRVGIPIEYFLSYDLDDREEVEKLLSGPFDFSRLVERTGERRRSGRQVDQFIGWMKKTDLGAADKLTQGQAARVLGDFLTAPHDGYLSEPRDKLASSRNLWNQIKCLIGRLQMDYAIEFQFVSMRHTWLSIPVYFVISRQELASNLHRFDGLKYGRPQGTLAEPYDMAVARNRGTCFGTQPKQRILMGIHVLQEENKNRLLLTAQRARGLIRRDFDEVFTGVDLLLAPTVNSPAPIFGGFADTVTEQYLDEFSVPANHAGVPAISVPLYREHDGWQSVQVIAKEFDEYRMFLLAAAIEDCRDRKEES